MYRRLLAYLRCPQCGGSLELIPLAATTTPDGDEISEGLLRCGDVHWYPVIRGIPRMLSDALAEHWRKLEEYFTSLPPESLRTLREARRQQVSAKTYDRRTYLSFSEEWKYHEGGGTTWGIALEDRVKYFFLDPIRLPPEAFRNLVMLDAGCGNGSQSVAYTAFGMEVIAIDLSTGLEHGYAYRSHHLGAQPAKVHFVQGDLQHPPLAPASMHLIHSAGVLHHTPDTRRSFHVLRRLLLPGGTFYIWVYKYEPFVTPLVNALRTLTTRIPPRAFTGFAWLMAAPFQIICVGLNTLGLRAYPRLSRREAALALMDIFGAPFAHYHSFAEVRGWYEAAGFQELWACSESRRGFGACGRLGAEAGREEPEPVGRHAIRAS